MAGQGWAVACVMSVTGLVALACAPPPTNRPPVAVITATPRSGVAPLEVRFSASGSTDPDGRIVAYEWSFGGSEGTLGGPDASHTWASPGTHTARLTVTDDSGLTDTASVDITVVAPATLASESPVGVRVVDGPIALRGTGEWDLWELREPGAVIHDPVTDTWILPYTGRGNTIAGNSAVTASIGALLSSDGGATWSPHPQNPITGPGGLGGVGQGEDPYLAKDAATGALWRDSAGRALMFTEEKDFDLHRGVNLWRSGPNTLSDWTLVGRVLDRGPAGAWDATDRTSPLVVHDGTRLVMFFEGRNLPDGQRGEIGLAVSTDEGETWTAQAEPVVRRGAPGTWNADGIVPDDLVQVGGRWVLLAHGDRGDRPEGNWSVGRYAAAAGTAAHRDGDGAFVEMAGNPLTAATSTVMAWGNDPTRAIQVDFGGQRIERLAVEHRPVP